GSAPYMSPEQLEGRKDVDHRTDLWSLGVVAYQTLTGELPFSGSSFVAVGAAVLRGRYRPVTELLPELPAALDDWFAKALAPEADARFASGRAMTRALARACAAAAVITAGDAEAATPSERRGLAEATTEQHAVAP